MALTKEQHAVLIEKARQWPLGLLIAKTVWAEGRGEPREGRIAIAYVMKRRETDGNLRNDILDPWQFSCYNYGDPNFEKLMSVGVEDKAFWECVEVAFMVLHNQYPDPAKADHYINSKTATAKDKWWERMTFVTRIGKHDFYRSKNMA